MLQGDLIAYDIVHIIHIFAVFIYGGFLITDNLFLAKLKNEYTPQEHAKVRESFMKYVRKVVPNALLVAVVAGGYLFGSRFGPIEDGGLTNFQMVLSLKAFLGLWLGFRGFNQKFFKIQPWVFKSHLFPFSLVIIIIFLSQFMYMV